METTNERIYQPKLVRVTDNEPELFEDKYICGKEMMHLLGLKHKNAQYYALRYSIRMMFYGGRKMYSLRDTEMAAVKRNNYKK